MLGLRFLPRIRYLLAWDHARARAVLDLFVRVLLASRATARACTSQVYFVDAGWG